MKKLTGEQKKAIIEKYRKIKELAERGVGGEKETAERLCEKLRQMYDLEILDELDDFNIRRPREYRAVGTIQQRLLFNVLGMVVKFDPKLVHEWAPKNIRRSDAPGDNMVVYTMSTTGLEEQQIDLYMAFYGHLIEEEAFDFASAFMEKQGIKAASMETTACVMAGLAFAIAQADEQVLCDIFQNFLDKKHDPDRFLPGMGERQAPPVAMVGKDKDTRK